VHDRATQALFAPAAELLLDAMGQPAAGSWIACVEPGSGALFRGLCANPSLANYPAVCVDPDPAALVRAGAPRRGGRVRGDPLFVPLASERFDTVLANLALGDPDLDVAVLRGLVRLLAPGGRLLASALLVGTMDRLYEAAAELSGASQGEAEESGAIYDPEGLLRACKGVGLTDVHVGVEERALLYPSAYSLTLDPLVQTAYPPEAVRSQTDPRGRAATLSQISEILVRVMGPRRFPARIVTGIVTARKS
jgi:SAM-dependent methyltransferase